MGASVAPQRQSEVTPIPAGKEAEFAAWLVRNRVTDLDHPDSHYDYRGAFLAGATRDPKTGHWPDPWKQHGHESFSVESQYARPNDPEAGHWVRGQYVRPVTAPISPEPLSDHDLYDQLRDRGLSHADAVKRVEFRRTVVAKTATRNTADSAAAAPSAWLAAPVAFGQGASLGAASKIGDLLPGQSNTAYLEAARQAHPWVTGGADALGMLATGALAGPLVKGLSAAKGAAVLGGLTGAARGAIEPELFPLPGFSRGETALVMGIGGSIGSGLATKLVSKLLPIAVTVGKNAGGIAMKLVGKLTGSAGAAAAPEAKQLAEHMTEAAVRAELKRLNVHPDVAERTVQAWKTGKVPQGPIDLPPPEPTVSRVGETITPTEPQPPALRRADAMATQPAYVRAGNPRGLPAGPGPTATPPGIPLGVPGTLQALEQQLGRPLTPPETQSVLERLLGPPGGLPPSYGRPQ